MEHSIYPDNLTGKYEGPQIPNTPLRLLSVKTIIGEKLRTPNGEEMGKVHDVMLDVIHGEIEYYVVEFGGFLGFHEKLFAIPSKLIRVDTDAKSLIILINRDVFEKAPGFDKNHWPLTNEHQNYVTLDWSFWENPG